MRRAGADIGPGIGRLDHHLVAFRVGEGKRAAGEILRRPRGIINIRPHHIFQPFDVFRTRPFQVADCGAGADELEIVARRAGLGEEIAPDLDAVTGHVGQNAAALAPALPEPRHVWPAMLLGRARQIGAAAGRHGAPPHDVLAALNGAGEHLVLQIAVQQLGVFGESQHLARFRERPPERLFAGDADKLRPARRDEAMDFAHGLEPREIRHADPDRVDFAGKQHRFERGKARQGPSSSALAFAASASRCAAVGL